MVIFSAQVLVIKQKKTIQVIGHYFGIVGFVLKINKYFNSIK